MGTGNSKEWSPFPCQCLWRDKDTLQAELPLKWTTEVKQINKSSSTVAGSKNVGAGTSSTTLSGGVTHNTSTNNVVNTSQQCS